MRAEPAVNLPLPAHQQTSATKLQLRGLALSPDQFFAESVTDALSGPNQPALELAQCAHLDEAKRYLSATPYQFALVDARADPERAMVALSSLRAYAPALTLILTGAPVAQTEDSFARQAFVMGASDVVHGPPWPNNVLGHSLIRAARQTAAALENTPPPDADDAAESTGETRRNLMAEVGHEMRSPLGTIIGFAQSIEQEAVGPIAQSADQYRDYARTIRASGEHLLALFEDLLEIGSATARSIAGAETVTPGKIVSQVAAMVQSGINAKELTLQTIESPSAPTVFGNRRLVQQAVLNLLQNAIKFTPPGGTIWLECAGGDQSCLCITVRDNGIGMEQSTLDRIRARTPQLEATAQGGHGLGLPFVDRVAAAHAGHFELESALGTGTSARLTLPINRQEKAPA